MGRRAKHLNQLVVDGSFLARRPTHRERLLEDDVSEPALREIQERAQDAAVSEADLKEIAREFEQAIADGAGGPGSMEELERELKKLGPPGSAKRTIGIFPRFFRFEEGERFTLDGWQASHLREGHKRRKGRRVYKEIDWWIPRGNGKTPIASGSSVDAALRPVGRPRVFQIAGDKEQGKIGLEYCTDWIVDGELARFFDAQSRVIRRRDGRAKIEVLPAGGAGAHGRKPTVAIVDEIWGFESKAQVKTYRALETAMFKRLESYLFTISTAGYSKKTLAGAKWDGGFSLPKVETFREGFLTIGRDEENGRLFIAYGMPDGYELDLEDDKAVLRALRLANPGSWVDHGELLRALRRTDEDGINDFLRFNLNYWTKAKGAWFKHGIWQAIASEFEFRRGDIVFAGVDCSLVHDTAAVAWAKRLENGRIAVDVEVFSPVEGVAAHRFFAHGIVDTRELRRFVFELARARGYRIAEIAYDPTFFNEAAAELKEAGFRMIEYLTAETPYKQAIQDFYRWVHDGTITHRGDNEVFNAHAEAVAAEKRETYWALYRLKASDRFDAIPAAALAVTRCAFDKRSVYEKDSLLVLEEPAPANRGEAEESGRTSERISKERARELGLLEVEDEDDDYPEEEDEEW